MREKILITGGTGFIGYHLIKRLKNNFNVISLSSSKPKIDKKIKNITYLKSDIYKKASLFKKLNSIDVDYVINLAGYVDHSNKKKTTQTHYYGCKNLVDYFCNKKIKLFLQIGSSLEYGNKRSPHHESLKCKPNAVYGNSKLKSTKYILKTAKYQRFPFVILRLYQVYGPNQRINRLIPIVINSCLKNKKFKCSPGLQTRDFLYIDDLVRLISKIIHSKKKIEGIFNVGSDRPIKVREVIEMIKKKIKKGKPQYGEISMRKDESNQYFPSIKKISKQIHWRPRVSLSLGLKKTIKFYKQNN